MLENVLNKMRDLSRLGTQRRNIHQHLMRPTFVNFRWVKGGRAEIYMIRFSLGSRVVGTRGVLTNCNSKKIDRDARHRLKLNFKNGLLAEVAHKFRILGN